MLFLLTGDVQIGKTRWLERLAEELAGEGAAVAGVLAPGVWRERKPHEAAGKRGLSGEGRFEKLGIHAVLLPQGDRIPFALRRDLALAEGSFDPASQSAAAHLGWEISDEAIARINAHFDRIAAEEAPPAKKAADPAALEPRQAGSEKPAPDRADPMSGMFHVKHPFVQTSVPCTGSGAEEGGAGFACSAGGLLVVDELGRLELVRGAGLTSAVALLDAGPTRRFPHALAVVRAGLCGLAEARFSTVWGGTRALAPDDAARAVVRAACGLSA